MNKGQWPDMITALLEWYRQTARDLPWRQSPTAYHVWVSEIMLQQTRVEAVKGYYSRFLEALPDVKALAEAEEERLLKLWEGLGYYSRVRNMQKAARIILEQFEGAIPSDYATLLKLPGIGAYTAGAISSIAFGKRQAAVDGNVLRVMTRLTENSGDISTNRVKKEITDQVQSLLTEKWPGDCNQALMELGATVCLPNGVPLCRQCPVQKYCKSFQKGTMLDYPVKPAKKQRKIEQRTVFLLISDNQVGLRKRPSKGLLAGLWEFPNVLGWLDEENIKKQCEEWGFFPLRIEAAKPAKHIFTHIEWHMKGYFLWGEKGKGDLVWAAKQDMEEIYSIPSAFQSFADELEKRLE